MPPIDKPAKPERETVASVKAKWKAEDYSVENVEPA